MDTRGPMIRSLRHCSFVAPSRKRHSLSDILHDKLQVLKKQRRNEAAKIETCEQLSLTKPKLNEAATARLGNGEQLSTAKTCRTEMLKLRYADTILRASQKMEEISDKKKQQQSGVTSKKLKFQCSNVIASQKSQEVKSKRLQEAKLKMLRERERSMARIALSQMELTTEIYDNHKSMKELELLACRCLNSNLMEMLGLVLKHEEYSEEEEDVQDVSSRDDVEEGEIVD